MIKTPGGQLRYLHIKKKGSPPKCGDCGIKLPGVSAYFNDLAWESCMGILHGNWTTWRGLICEVMEGFASVLGRQSHLGIQNHCQLF